MNVRNNYGPCYNSRPSAPSSPTFIHIMLQNDDDDDDDVQYVMCT